MLFQVVEYEDVEAEGKRVGPAPLKYFQLI
jgi:hypothetical protein